MQIEYRKIIEELYYQIKALPVEGQVAGYIPELKAIDPGKFGVHLCTLDGQHFGIGDDREKFSIQSIGKVLSLTLAFQQKGESLWERVGWNLQAAHSIRYGNWNTNMANPAIH